MLCKFTDENLRSYNDFQWSPMEWRDESQYENNPKDPNSRQSLMWQKACPIPVDSALVHEGWLHAYKDPLLAAFLWPSSGLKNEGLLWEVETDGDLARTPWATHVKSTRMRITKRLEVPRVTPVNRVAFALLASMVPLREELWVTWARGWLENKNRGNVKDSCAIGYILRHADESAGWKLAPGPGRGTAIHAARLARLSAIAIEWEYNPTLKAAHLKCDAISRKRADELETKTLLENSAFAVEFASDSVRESKFDPIPKVDWLVLAKRALEVT